MSEFRFMPEQASTLAAQIDHLYYFYLAVCGSIGFLIFVLVAVFAARYRRRSENDTPAPPGHSLGLEIGWSVLPLVIVLVLFVWGARIYIVAYTPPEHAMEIFVTGKQWMWKIQHPAGKREINQLHVPVGQPVKLTMTSEDVIHSFYVPAFRTKKDVLPGRYTTLWFEATQAGTYHLFCAEYCGAEHSRMIGQVVAMPPSEYHDWLAGGEPVASMAALGRDLFLKHGCTSCHRHDSGARGPDLSGLYGNKVKLSTGTTVIADDNYLRESIVHPNTNVVAGYAPVMPTFAGQIDEQGIAQLVAYIRTLATQPTNPRSPRRFPPPATGGASMGAP